MLQKRLSAFTVQYHVYFILHIIYRWSKTFFIIYYVFLKGGALKEFTALIADTLE